MTNSTTYFSHETKIRTRFCAKQMPEFARRSLSPQESRVVLALAERNERAGWSQPVDLVGSACWARTSDPLINSQLLYQLS